MAHSLRSMGSAALNFALVAQGGLDLYWYNEISLLSLLGVNMNIGRSDAGHGMFAPALSSRRKLAEWLQARMTLPSPVLTRASAMSLRRS